jgi:hypothetical protein
MRVIVDPLSVLPDSTKERLLDATLSGLARLADNLPGKTGRQLRRLRSDGRFRKQFDNALEAGRGKFMDQYQRIDPTLSLALDSDSAFWASEEMARSIEDVIARPGATNVDQRARLYDTIQAALPETYSRERVEQASDFLLSCLAEEVWFIPSLQQTYALFVQRITAAQTTAMAQELKLIHEENLSIVASAEEASGPAGNVSAGQVPAIQSTSHENVSSYFPDKTEEPSKPNPSLEAESKYSRLMSIREKIVANPIHGLESLTKALEADWSSERLHDVNLWRSELAEIETRRRRYGRANDDEIRQRQIVYEVLRLISDLK